MIESRSRTAGALTLLGFALLALAITAVGGGIWTALLLLNLRSSPAIPWSVPVMAVLLWLIWNYLGGKGWPLSTSEARRHYLRANQSSGHVYAWALAAGIFSVIALAGLWIVFFELIRMPPNAIPDVSIYPRTTVALMVVMGSLVAPFMEEAGFRGYFQVALESRFSALVAVTMSSLLFAIAHLTHGFFWPKLLVYFLVGVAFGAIACITNSTLPAIPSHVLGDLAFFTLVWPKDAARPLIWQNGTDLWFWLHLMQFVVFAILAVWGFQKLARVSATESQINASP
jgi:membrane protease YdiL (CAAX protease family)